MIRSSLPPILTFRPPVVTRGVAATGTTPRFGVVQGKLYEHLPAQVVLASSTNLQGEAKIGMVLDMIDIAGGLVASRFCQGRPVVTRSLDRMEFGEPAKKFEYLTTQASITYAGGRSMEVALTLDAHNYKTPEYRRHTVAKGYLTYTLFDKNRKPIPETTPFASKGELNNYIHGENRRQNRVREKEALKKLGTPDQFYIGDKEHSIEVDYQTTDKDANIHGIVFGGVIMDLIYRSAEKAAEKWAKAPIKAIRQDRMNFDKPGKVGNLLTARSVVTRTWDGKQMEVQVELYSKKPQQPSWKDWLPYFAAPAETPTVPIATSLFIFEAKDGKTPVTPVVPKTDVQKRRWQAAEIRRQSRAAEQKQNAYV